MRFQERPHDDVARREAQMSGPGGPEGRELTQLRQRGEAFLNAGDVAINRGLSGDSERFLTAGRQQGGQ